MELDFNYLTLIALALLAVTNFATEREFRKMKRDHDRLSRVTLYALRDLKWSGISEDDERIVADANPRNVLPFRKD